jgi:hypothetical protein
MASAVTVLPPELLREVENFIEKHKHKGYTRRRSSYVKQYVY